MPTFQKKWFTLAELMIVVTIISILSLAAMNFDFNKKTTREKRDHIITMITSVLDTETIHSTLGKGVDVSGSIVNPSTVVLEVQTGSIISRYYSGNIQIGTGAVLWHPFFSDYGFNIANIYYRNKDLSTTGNTDNALKIIFDSSGNISFSGSTPIANAVIIEMELGYNAERKKLSFDRRTGKISID